MHRKALPAMEPSDPSALNIRIPRVRLPDSFSMRMMPSAPMRVVPGRRG